MKVVRFFANFASMTIAFGVLIIFSPIWVTGVLIYFTLWALIPDREFRDAFLNKWMLWESMKR